jgi:mono/diheme cytochrome c family protein
VKRQVFAVLVAALLAAPAAADDVARGAYLARLMDCGGCHTPGALLGKPDAARPLAGGDVGFEIPQLGIFYPPNLTPDAKNGLGAWSEADIVRALREGVRPDGRQLAPAMPWRSYAVIDERDAKALAAYLKSLPATPVTVPGPVGPSEPAPAPYLTLVVPK